MSIYQKELYNLIHGNRMYDYEEVNMSFIATKLININREAGRKLSLIIRSDYIVNMTYWLIRYFRAKHVEPKYILSTKLVKQEYGDLMGIPIVSIDELSVESTKDCILIYINRESDTQVFTQENYREADYGFAFRGRGKLQFVRGMGVVNYAYIAQPQHEEQYYKILECLEDEESKRTFIEVIRSLLENDIYRRHEDISERKYFDSSIYQPLNEQEVWINCGSSTGDTILHYISQGRKYHKIYAVETDAYLIGHLRELFKLLPQGGDAIEILDQPFDGKGGKNSIDSVFGEEKITLINMDIEGAEQMVLQGAEDKIKKDLPVLAVAAYHKPDDLLEIPRLIASISDEYHFYFRKYRGWAPDVINEYIYYAVPTYRMVKTEDNVNV